jgi:transposase
MEENLNRQRPRRRQHSTEFKACMQPDVSIAAVALHYRLNANLLRRWVARQEELDEAAARMVALSASIPSGWQRSRQIGKVSSNPS